MKRMDPNLKGFYMDIPYPRRIRKIVIDHAKIMPQILEGSIGEEEMLCRDSLELDVTLEEEEDPVGASWVTKGNKRKKVVHIPEEVK